MSFSVASFNVKNLIGPEKEFYEFLTYTREEYAWKRDWLSDQLLAMDADIVGFQEIFEEEALEEVVAECDAKGAALNDISQPGIEAPYRRRSIFRRLKYTPYNLGDGDGGAGGIVYAPNMHDTGEPGRRRPGLAVLSRYPILDAAVIQDLSADPVEMDLPQLGGGTAGSWRLTNLSRPILRVRVEVEGRTITLLNCHLKSKLGEFERDAQGRAPEQNMLFYDPLGRAAGELRAALRRCGEALVLRRLILEEIGQGNPVIALGDFNDNEHAVSSQIIAGEKPFHNYSWLRRHDATHPDDRYTKQENEQIQEAVRKVLLVSAEAMFVRRALRDLIYTSSFNGVYESIDQILLSHHFQQGHEGQVGELEYLQCFNDHLSDDSFADAPYNKLASDHGQLVATLRWGRKDG